MVPRGGLALRRDPEALARGTFDVLVVGAGIHGAWAAWDATLRGLRTALIDRGDLGGATSANSLKIAHGGFRHLGRLDIGRARESAREVRRLLAVAPDLVRPLPCLVPTYGRGLGRRGRLAFGAALALYELVGPRVARGRLVAPSTVRAIVPGLSGAGLTGGAVFYDGQVESTERLLIAIVHSAAEAGAVVANYVAAEALLREGPRVVGARARDLRSASSFDLRARVTLNAAGPWADRLLDGAYGRDGPPHPPLHPATQAWNLVLSRQLVEGYAVGLSPPRAPSRAAAGFAGCGPPDGGPGGYRDDRLLFFVPWRGRTLVGTSHLPYPDDRDGPAALLEDAAAAYPAAGLTEADVAFAHFGIVPGTVDAATGRVTPADRPIVRDHGAEDGVPGLVSMVGPKLTTARLVAERAVDAVVRRLGRRAPQCRTATTPLETAPLEGVPLAAAVERAVRDEMAVTLSDAVRRRTELGAAGFPGDEALARVADVMARELGWDAARRAAEIAETRDLYRRFIRRAS